MADAAFGDVAGPPGDERDAHTALPCHAFAAAQFAGTALIPRAVIARKEEEGIFVEVVFFQRLHDLADGPIEFGDDVAVNTVGALAAEGRAGGERDMRIRVREVEEERGGFIFPDKFLN